MVVLDNSAIIDTQPRWRPRLTLALLIALAAVAVGLSGFALRGFTDNGLGFGAQLIWRFDCMVFFAALIAGPAGRIVPPLHALADKGRPLLQGFCAGIAVYFAAIILPNLLRIPDSARQQSITPGMTFFVFFTGGITLVMAAANNRSLCVQVGRRACRAILSVSVIYFWLCYSLIGLAHISGPHRPDQFYAFSVILMVLGLFSRFADCFVAAWRRPVPAP